MDFRTWLADDILVKVDRMSMAHGLEVRVPLLDTDFVSYAACLPVSAKLQGGKGKQLFRQALRGRIPDQTLDRPKQGFHLPLDAWLGGPLQVRLRALVNDRGNQLFDYVDADIVATDMEEHGARIANRSADLWFVLVLDAFLHHGPQTHRRAAA
jgi:asparagine synthase (glutamine-hydrolysing)